ncbi:MAG: hypothetical protein U0670_20630 [Anaerolineae bacterium]
MRFRTLVSLITLLMGAVVLFTLAGCQTEPPTVVYIVLSPTPETTVEPSPSMPPTAEPTTEAAPPTAETVVESATSTPLGPIQAVTPTRTPIPPNFPTPLVARIQVVEQLYEHGRMFWLEPNREIWVLVVTAEGRGTWTVYQDTWEEGVDPESDPSLTPPDGLIQPHRGFGKLWREVPGVREALGWAASAEFGYLSDYQYVAGGSIDANGQYVPGPGYHVLYSLYGEQFRFNEVDSTWQLGGG